jgi:hypothetical protein
MAATKRNAMAHEEARRKIKTTQLINRLQDHVFGKIDLSQSQVSATGLLLKKVLPDLAVMQLTGADGDPIEFIHRVIIEDQRQMPLLDITPKRLNGNGNGHTDDTDS